MKVDKGQNLNEWNKFWMNTSPISEIQSWDFYGGRQWLSKYIPRVGTVVEAGCGLGRFVFYFSRLGIDIIGLDFSKEVIDEASRYKDIIDPGARFIKGDVTQMPFKDNSLSGYLSLGVVEHFIEGPQKAIREAYRVLRPGGIAIITTPNISFSQWFIRTKRAVKDFVKILLGYPPRSFFQYEYRPSKLSKFIKSEGFHVARSEGCDIFYAMRELWKFGEGKSITDRLTLRLSAWLEKTSFRHNGAQSITISVKTAPRMYCFLSGKLTATRDSLEIFDVPISKEYYDSPLASLFLKNRPVLYSEEYKIFPPLLKVEKRICNISGEEYLTDEIFEDFGFNKNISPKYLYKKEINIELCTKNIKPVFRRK